MVTFATFLVASTVLPTRTDPAQAISDDPRVLAQTLMDARAAGRFDSISFGVVSQIIAPVARGETPAAGCRLDTRVFQVLVSTLESFGSVFVSDLARSCPGASQDPPCPTSYVSPHCANPVRAIDFVRVGGVVLRGGSESMPFLRFIDSFVPRGTLAGQVQCGSDVSFDYITERIPDTCNHIHLALPVGGALRVAVDPPRPSENVLGKVAIGSPDFNGDGFNDVFRITGDGVLYHLRGDGKGSWLTSATVAGSGWDVFASVDAVGDFGGDDRADLIGITPDGVMRLYSGDGAGGWLSGTGQIIGTAWNQFSFVFSPGDFSGDGHVDVIAVRPDGAMLLYVGNGTGGWATGTGRMIGSSWNQFSKIFSPYDFTGDGHPDVMAIDRGALRLYTGNGVGGWANPAGAVVGTSWDQFVSVTSPGDFSGDAKSDLLAVTGGGVMLMYRADGAGGWITGAGEPIGSGWW